MTEISPRAFRLRACATCGGDAYIDMSDEPEWRCLQCGRLVPEEQIALARTGRLKAA